MLSESERVELIRSLGESAARSYADLAKDLTQKLGRNITRNTVRHYLGSLKNAGKLPKGRPKGAGRKQDVWERLIPELLALTGLAASSLYRELSALLDPVPLPFRESVFHERTGRRKRSQTAGPNNERATLLTRCRLRIRVIEVLYSGDRKKRLYLFGYEEVTGYISFDVIANSHPDALQIARFVKDMERHLGLPLNRVCTINIELPAKGFAIHLPDTEIECSEERLEFVPLPSPLDRKTEIDLLARLTKKQNNNVARKRAVGAKLAIAELVLSEQIDRTWRRRVDRDIYRRKLADALKPSLEVRFKLRTPSRRP